MREFIESHDSSYATSGKNKAELTEMYEEVLQRIEAGELEPVTEVEETEDVEVIEETEPQAKKETYSKVKANPFYIGECEIGKEYELTEKNKRDKDFMRRLRHAIKIGLIKQD